VLLAVASIMVLIPAWHYVSPYTPLGDDASSHIATISSLASALATGDGWWSTDYNGGFPMGLYYQPLPHLASAAMAALLGGASAASGVYKVAMVALLAIQPWAVWVGLRRAGLGELEAAAAGLLTPLVINGIQFGYHAQASLSVGLFTQAWGNVALPLAFGELAAIAAGRGRTARAVAACAFVTATHMFYAIALVVPASLFALFGGRTRRAVPQLCVTGLATFATLSAWLIPLATTQAYFGGWPFGRDLRVNGYGFEALFASLGQGSLMDGEAGIGVITLLGISGAAVAVHTLMTSPLGHRRKGAGFLLGLALWALLGAAGRNGLGALVDLYPFHRSVQLFRYGAVLQFAMLGLAGVGLAAFARLATRFGGNLAGMMTIAALAALPLSAGVEQLNEGFRTIDDSTAFVADDYAEVVSFVRGEERGGRMYVGKRVDLRGHYHSGLMAWTAGRPAAQSYGVGLHDSLHFYALEYLHPASDGALELMDVYDFRIVVHGPDADLGGLGEMERIFDNETYRVSRLDVSSEAVMIMTEAGERIDGTPRGVRSEVRAWMQGNGAAARATRIVEIDEPSSREGLIGHPGPPPGPMTFVVPARPGEVMASTHRGATFSAEVTLDVPALVVAKVGYHPFWRVWVDERPVETHFALPGFVAVEVGPGTHQIRGAFRWPAYSKLLCILTLLPLVLAAHGRRRLQRGDEPTTPTLPSPSAAPTAGSKLGTGSPETARGTNDSNPHPTSP